MAKSDGSRGLRDEMNVGPDPRSAHRLVPLNELGKFRIADGEPDIRGWTAYTSTGREIGRVHELLVDTDAREVVMLDIDLRRDDRHTMVPIRASWVDQSTKRVVVDAAEVPTGDEIPSVGRGTVAPGEGTVNALDDRRLAIPLTESDASARRDYADEREVERRPIVDEEIARRRSVGDTDAAHPDDRDSLLGPRPDDAAGPRR